MKRNILLGTPYLVVCLIMLSSLVEINTNVLKVLMTSGNIGFIAVVVTAIILLSETKINPLILTALTAFITTLMSAVVFTSGAF